MPWGACKRAIDGKKGNKAAPKNTESVDESVDGKGKQRVAPKKESDDESVDENEDFTVQGENRNEICVQRDDVDYSQTVEGNKFYCTRFKTKLTCTEPTARVFAACMARERKENGVKSTIRQKQV